MPPSNSPAARILFSQQHRFFDSLEKIPTAGRDFLYQFNISSISAFFQEEAHEDDAEDGSYGHENIDSASLGCADTARPALIDALIGVL